MSANDAPIKTNATSIEVWGMPKYKADDADDFANLTDEEYLAMVRPDLRSHALSCALLRSLALSYALLCSLVLSCALFRSLLLSFALFCSLALSSAFL